MGALNILLVDDDRILATTLSHGLRKAMGKNISVVFCASGPEASALLATQTFDLVISDFHMVGISGLELLKQIRQDHPKTSLVLITAYGTDALEQEVHRLEIGYITKPFELPSLVQLIQNLIQLKETIDKKENVPPNPIREGNVDSGPLMTKVLIDPIVPN
jgi:Response regulator containing CheY-like receiver, AAA-type ATPase, and DNA-binding domains